MMKKLASFLKTTKRILHENKTLPETFMLPVLAQVFECSIDELLMPAYVINEEIEKNRPNILEHKQNILPNT